MTEETAEKTTAEEDIPVVDCVEDIQPMEYDELYNRVLCYYIDSQWGDSEEEINGVFQEKFGVDFENKKIDKRSKKNKELFREIAKEVLDKRLMHIKKEATSLIDDNVNQAMKDILELVGVNLDLTQTALSTCEDVLKQRAGHLPEFNGAYDVLFSGRRLFDWYNAGVVSPEINEDVLKMQNMYRNGIINREILAFYYYNVAMVYEKYSMQKNNAPAVYKEHYRAVEFIKKSLSKVDKSVSLVMTIKDFLAAEPNYDQQKVLDACHRIMDNNNDDHSLYLAHKLYAETLKESRNVKGFAFDKQIDKIAEHYRIALGYTTASEDKIDILEAIADSQKLYSIDAYIDTQLEIADLLSGRQRIRALKNIAHQVKSQNMKTALLKGAINEFVDLDNIRGEDIAMFRSLERNLRFVAADEPETMKILDKLGEKYKTKKARNNVNFFAQMSSKGHDIFTK